MQSKKISVIMGIYNSEDTLDVAINSIIDQTYENWELIMCDDGSTDNSFDIAKKYKDKFPDKIRLLKNKTNIKLAATLNHCLRYVEGDYIARMDADDISLPNRFEEQVKFLEGNLQYDLVGSQMISFNEHGYIGLKGVIEKPDKYYLRYRAPFAHATIMCKKKVYDDLNGYRTSKEIRRCEDIDLWFRFFSKGFSGYNIQQPLYKVREDNNAFKRRSFKYGVDAAIVCLKGYKLLNYPKRYYILLLKPLISSAMPTWILKNYHSIKDRKRSLEC